MAWDALWIDVNLATMDEGAGADGYGTIRNGALAVSDGRIAWVGRRVDLPSGSSAAVEHDGHGAWLTPGLIDCHTHLIYAGNRANEFESRLAGASYQDIAKAGGGIASTVHATRAASEDGFFTLTPHLPAEASEALLEYAATGRLVAPVPAFKQ